MILISKFRENQYTVVEDTRCIEIRIPNDDSYLAILASLINLLGNELNYEGDDTNIATIAQTWRDAYVETDWLGCNTVTIPVGTVVYNPSNIPDAGWLLCDGTQYDRVDFPLLSAVLPDDVPAWGEDENVFILPNITGRAVIGAGASPLTPAQGYDVGDYGGNPTHTLTLGQIPSHDHVWLDTGAGASGNTLTSNGTGFSAGNGVASQWETHLAGSGQAHNNMQPYIPLFAWIYTGE